MDGKVVILNKNPEGKQTLGVETGGEIFPATPCKGATRNLQPGYEISYMTLRGGGVYIFSRERKR